jgi:hypothetical protein
LQIILSLQQNSSIYSKKLRSVTDLCGENWEMAMEVLRLMIQELNKPDFVLYFEFEVCSQSLRERIERERIERERIE